MIDCQLTCFDYKYDYDLLFNESQDMTGYQPFVDPLTKKVMNGWLIKKISAGYAKHLSDKFQKAFQLSDCKPRFYLQMPDFNIPWHKDRGTQCSFNFILKGEQDPISFRDRDVVYTTALLNTQQEHAVANLTTTRVLFKISVFDRTYEDIRNVLFDRLPR